MWGGSYEPIRVSRRPLSPLKSSLARYLYTIAPRVPDLCEKNDSTRAPAAHAKVNQRIAVSACAILQRDLMKSNKASSLSSYRYSWIFSMPGQTVFMTFSVIRYSSSPQLPALSVAANAWGVSLAGTLEVKNGHSLQYPPQGGRELLGRREPAL